MVLGDLMPPKGPRSPLTLDLQLYASRKGTPQLELWAGCILSRYRWIHFCFFQRVWFVFAAALAREGLGPTF